MLLHFKAVVKMLARINCEEQIVVSGYYCRNSWYYPGYDSDVFAMLHKFMESFIFS